MTGGGRKSQDLMFNVKLSNSQKHTSHGTVGGKCTTTLHPKIYCNGAASKWNSPTCKPLRLKNNHFQDKNADSYMDLVRLSSYSKTIVSEITCSTKCNQNGYLKSSNGRSVVYSATKL